MMKVLIGGLVGAVLGSAIWLGAEHFTQSSYGWLSCLVGVLAGVFAKLFDRANLTPGTVRGGISVIVTLAAIVLGRQVYAKIIQVGPEPKNATVSLPKDMESPSTQDASKEEASSEEDSKSEKIELLDRAAPASVDSSQKIKPNAKRASELDTLWMSLAALAAYVISQGSQTVVSESTSEQRPEEDSPESEKSEE